jgi:hypothetical protein
MKRPTRFLLLASALLPFLSPLANADTTALTSFSGSTEVYAATNQLYGWIFTANADIDVTSLGVYDGNGASGLSVSHEVGIYDETNETLLGFTTIPAGTGPTLLDGFEYESVTPFLLTQGDSYVIVMTMPGGMTDADYQYVNVSSETTASQITYDNSDFDYGSSLAFPTDPGGYAPGIFGPNFEFESVAATPEPASFTLFGSGFLALGLVAFYRRSAGKRTAPTVSA